METLVDEFVVAPTIPWPILLSRLIGSVLLCGLIGIERESRDRPAGLRTHMLVGLAAAVYCLVTLDIIARFGSGPDMVRLDPLRLIEAVTGGVAFLAAGLIVFAKGEVRGLTTGASLWLCAAVGLAIGLGLWGIAAATTLIALVVMRLLVRVEPHLGKSARSKENGDSRSA